MMCATRLAPTSTRSNRLHIVVCMLQVAYLASGLFLDYKSDLIILVVNTLTQDLKSDNYLVGEILSLLAHMQPAAASQHQ